jgi:diguanylate cyclase (GGDEF)-like protein
MTKVSRLDLSTFPDSPYAEELQRDLSRLRFSRPQLEAEYQRSRMLSSRSLIRVACAFAAVITIARGAELLYTNTWNTLLLIELSMVMGTSIALAAISWSTAFERLYPRWAPVVVPVRNAVIAAQIAVAAAQGQSEILMALPISLIGPFFFLGLPFRGSLFCGAVTVVSYVTAATLLGLPYIVALHSYVLLGCGVVACVIAVWHLEKVSRQSFLEGQLISELAARDSLTGTKNRRVFDEHLELLWQQAIANRRAIAILLIDIDHFKDYNDFYGHQAGDHALRQVAQTIQKMIRRPLDILTRYGGEEFAAILYDVDAVQAKETADRVRGVVGELNIEHRASRPFSRVTISIGVAVIEPTTARSSHGAVQLADQALYEAKRQGRNRVELMDSNQHDLLETGVFAMAVPAVSHKPNTSQVRATSNARPVQARGARGA